MAIGVGVAMAGFAFLGPAKTIRGAKIMFIAVLVLMPLTVAFLPVEMIFDASDGKVPPSWLQRVAIWQSAGARLGEGLPFGFGADFAREWKAIAPMIDIPGAPVPMSIMPTHPHNVFVQIWLELGIPGALLMGGFVFVSVGMLERNIKTPIVAAGLMGAFGAVFVSLMLESSIWQVWRLAAIALAGMGVALSYSIDRKSH